MNLLKKAYDIETRGMFNISGVCFYFGVPIVVAYLMTHNFMMVAENASTIAVYLYYLGWMVFSWGATILMTNIMYFTLYKWEPKLLYILFLGQLTALIIFLWPARLYLYWGAELFPENQVLNSLEPLAFTYETFLRIVQRNIPNFVLWICLNLFYRIVLTIPRYQYGDIQETSKQSIPYGLPRFLHKLPEDIKGELLAMKAEDHYVRIYTENGNALIHCRFTDAIIDIEPYTEGIRVHRSYWVNPKSIVRLKSANKSKKLILKNDLTIPISRSYQNEVQKYIAENAPFILAGTSSA